MCTALGRPVAVGKPGLCIAYPDLIRLAYARQYWNRNNRHLDGAPGADPFDGFVLTVATGAANQNDRDQFTQMEANFSAFFGLAVQMYEQLLIPDDTPFDRFMDANPGASNGIGQPGEQAVLFPTLIRQLVTGSTTGNVNLVPGFGEDELFGFDIFAGGNLAAALPVGSARNPGGVGSNPFTRNARCMLCHLGPEQTDHTINISHGLLKGDAEFEFPGLSSFPGLPDGPSTGIAFTGPGGNTGGAAVPPPSIIIPSPEPPGPARVVGGLILADEIEGSAQDQVEVEPRGFALLDDPATPWDDRIVAQPRFFAFGDQGVYNVGLRPNDEDTGRGGDDPFGMPLSLSALALMNIGQPGFQPCDTPGDSCVMTNVDGTDLGATFEETGDGLPFPGTNGLYGLQSINPGFEKDPANPQLPPFLAPWAPGLPAGELHPQIDEMAFAPNTVTAPTGGPALEFGEAMFGADTHCGVYDPATFGNGPPNFGWGATDPITGALVAGLCPNNQSGVAGNWNDTLHGTWPVPNRVLRQGAFKAPQLRNVELTGPYFHTGSYLTLGQVVDFYLRGGDFPVTNAETRDPNILDVDDQSFGFGRTATGPDHGGAADTLYQPVSFGTLLGNGDTHVGSFADAFPDTVYRYDPMPDANHPLTREPATTTRNEASSAIVKLLLAMTDERVKFEKAPFDRPELFVPIDGLAPQNDFGVGLVSPLTPGTLNALASCSAATPCTLPGKDAVLGTPDDVIATSPVFRRIPAVGAAGNATPLQPFLGVTSVPPGEPGYNCVASAGAVSHFCSNIDP